MHGSRHLSAQYAPGRRGRGRGRRPGAAGAAHRTAKLMLLEPPRSLSVGARKKLGLTGSASSGRPPTSHASRQPEALPTCAAPTPAPSLPPPLVAASEPAPRTKSQAAHAHAPSARATGERARLRS